MLDALYGGICEGKWLLGGILALGLFILAGHMFDERARAKK